MEPRLRSAEKVFGTYKVQEWQLPLEGYLGKDLSETVPHLLLSSSFCPRWIAPMGYDNLHGPVVSTMFKAYEPVHPEMPGQTRQTGEDNSYWITASVKKDGTIVDTHNGDTYEQILSRAKSQGFVLGWCSRVNLQNLTMPFDISTGVHGHFPMIDIDIPPTTDNISRITQEVQKKCGIHKFFIIRSSKNGMFILSPELVNSNQMYYMLNKAGRIKGVHPNWISRSNETLQFSDQNELVPALHTCGILRLTNQPTLNHSTQILKPEQPKVVAIVSNNEIKIQEELTV